MNTHSKNNTPLQTWHQEPSALVMRELRMVIWFIFFSRYDHGSACMPVSSPPALHLAVCSWRSLQKVRGCDGKWVGPQCASRGCTFTDSPHTLQCHLTPSCACHNSSDVDMARKSTFQDDYRSIIRFICFNVTICRAQTCLSILFVKYRCFKLCLKQLTFVRVQKKRLRKHLFIRFWHIHYTEATTSLFISKFLWFLIVCSNFSYTRDLISLH